MAYCDYLLKRPSGIFYFRYVLKFNDHKTKEIRISLKTRNYSLAKPMAASCFVVLNNFIHNGGKLMGNADDTLGYIKNIIKNEIVHDDQENHQRFEKVYSEIEKKVLWVKKHLPDEFEHKSVESILSTYEKNYNIFSETKSKADKQEEDLIIDEIRKKAEKFYGIKDNFHNTTKDANNKSPQFTFLDIANKYSKEMVSGGNWTDKTKKENIATYTLFSELQGDIQVSEISKSNIASFKQQLQSLPKNHSKIPSIKEKPLTDLLKENHDFDTISTTTINKHLNIISTLLNWGVKNNLCQDNPAIGIKIKQRRSARGSRQPFSNSELSQIFSTDIYTQKKYLYSHYFWLPLLALFTGARLNELCQLDISDIKEKNGIMYISINDNDDKTLKNSASFRDIPIHTKLIEIGFLDYVNTNRKGKSQQKLFSEIQKGREGYGTAPSKWFQRFKKKLTLECPEKKVFHSFRHNFSYAMKQADIPTTIAKQLIGHSEESMTYGVYGSSAQLNQLKDNLEKIKYDIPEIENLKF